ncbi:MAG: S1C family serine protease [Nitrososphaerales archaeon]
MAILLAVLGPSARAQNSGQAVPTAKVFSVYAQSHKLVAKYRPPVSTRSAAGIAVYNAASPGVVLVFVGDLQGDKLTNVSLGSGVIMDPAGYVLTNWHVINGHKYAGVILKPSTPAELSNPRTYVGEVVSENSVVDLALIKLEKPPADLRVIPLGNMSDVQVAETINIIGHPAGGVPWSYSTGVISQISKDNEWSYEDGSKHEADVLQMQTAINPGNSGGPVLDDSGRLLGLVAMSREGSQNLDFAIAIDVIRSFTSQAMAGTR